PARPRGRARPPSGPAPAPRCRGYARPDVAAPVGPYARHEVYRLRGRCPRGEVVHSARPDPMRSCEKDETRAVKGGGPHRGGGSQPVMTFGLWGLAAAVVAALLLSAGDLKPWHGFLMAVPYLVATAWYGWTAAALLLPVLLLLVWGVDASAAGGALGPAGYGEI